MMNLRFRSCYVCVVCLSLLLLANAASFSAEKDPASDKPLIKTTHVYKTVGDVKVEADVYRAEAGPVVVWIS